MTAEGSTADLGAAAVHDVRGSVGSIRLAVTSVLADGDDDAEFRTMMLNTIEAETRRLDAALSGLQALIHALTDRYEPQRVELGDQLRRAAADAGRRQIAANVTSTEPTTVVARAAPLRAVLAALLGITADGDGAVSASTWASDKGAMIRIERADGGAILSERALVRSLLAALRGEQTATTDAVEFLLPDDDEAPDSRR